MPEDRVIDGRDPTATLAGKSPSPHEYLFFQFRKMSAARSGRHKIVRADKGQPFRLYDLEEDLGETTDLAAQQPEVVGALQRRFERWLAEVAE